MTNSETFEVIIIGGSYAGLSAAMALGRSLRKVLIIDSGFPCNRQAPHSHNFVTQDGRSPAAIAQKAKEQVLNYSTVRFLTGIAITAKKTRNGFLITTQTGQAFRAVKLIFATGIKDLMPDIEGFADCWGVSVIHCPYCHGYEFRGQKTGIMANGDRALHLAALVHNLTDDLVILTSGKAHLGSDQVSGLKRKNIWVIEKQVARIEHKDRHIRNVTFTDGTATDLQALYAALPFEQHSDLPESLGCELTDSGHIKVDGFQKTSVDGVFACGDNSAMMRSVANAVYSGNLTGAMVNNELADERFLS